MHNLQPVTPLGGQTPRVDLLPGITITEVADRALASLGARLGREAELATRAAEFLGAALPDAGQTSFGKTFNAFWLGPDSWMVDAPHDSHELLAHDLKQAVSDSASVVEQTDGWCRFDITGALAMEAFERLCNVDVRQMATGQVTRTRLEHSGCFVWCLEAGNQFAVIGPRSTADSIHHALMTAATVVAGTATGT